MTALNTENREYITWQYEQLNFGLLGGLKIEGLERMRVTLKVEYKQVAVRQNLDLYNNESLDKLVRRCAERFTLGTAYLAGAFAGLINELEVYRLEQLKLLAKEKEPVKQLTEAERKEAEEFLQRPDLLLRTNELIGRSGVIGEENSRLLMYLVFTSRKREEPLHVISLGSSGTGKTHLQEKVGELMPVEDVIQITSLSENAFYYFGKQELKHKLILIEDLDGTGEVLYPLRELQSKKLITKTVVYKNQAGEAQTVHLRVEGPICVAGCTTKESVYEDNSNRGTTKNQEAFVAKLKLLSGLDLVLKNNEIVQASNNISGGISDVLKNSVLNLIDEKGKNYKNSVVYNLVKGKEGFKSHFYGDEKQNSDNTFFDSFLTGAVDLEDFDKVKI